MGNKSDSVPPVRDAGADHPYDSILQRMLSDMSELLIPLVNVLFGTKFTTNAKITMHPREIMLREGDGSITERVVDSLFSIEEDNEERLIHIEFETSPRPAIRVRLVDYRFGIASEILGKTADHAAWTLPESGVVCLRSTLAGKPDYLYETYELSGVTKYEVDHVVYEKDRGPLRVTIGNPVLYMEDYKADRLIEHYLTMLMPFLLFAYMSDAEAMRNESVRKYILDEFRKVADYYVRESQKPNGVITIEQAAILAELTIMATEYLGSELPELVEGVKEIMYIKPIDTETTLLRDKTRRLEAQHARDKEKMAQDQKRIAQDKATIAQDKATIAQSEKRISQLEDALRAAGIEPPAPQMS